MRNQKCRGEWYINTPRDDNDLLNADLDGQLLHEEGHVVFTVTGMGVSPTITRPKTTTPVKIR